MRTAFCVIHKHGKRDPVWGETGFIPAVGNCTVFTMNSAFQNANGDGRTLYRYANFAGTDYIIHNNAVKSSGKWYYEAVNVNGSGFEAGFCLGAYAGGTNPRGNVGSWVWIGNSFWHNNVTLFTGPASAIGQVRAFAYDAGPGTMYCYVNGSLYGTVTGISSAHPIWASSVGGEQVTFNFGQAAFVYPVPAGYANGWYN